MSFSVFPAQLINIHVAIIFFVFVCAILVTAVIEICQVGKSYAITFLCFLHCKAQAWPTRDIVIKGRSCASNDKTFGDLAITHT
jgi:hypothetical protein